MRRIFAYGLAAAAGVYFWNASWLSEPPEDASLKLIAHRGVHQTFNREDLTNDTCTAERIEPPRHAFLENTIASMQAAFGAGADVVELDVHPTTDGRFAVFHDWTLDCRTDGKGVVREQTLATVKGLDIGYGYTADAARRFRFAAKGSG